MRPNLSVLVLERSVANVQSVVGGLTTLSPNASKALKAIDPALYQMVIETLQPTSVQSTVMNTAGAVMSTINGEELSAPIRAKYGVSAYSGPWSSFQKASPTISPRASVIRCGQYALKKNRMLNMKVNSSMGSLRVRK